MEYVRIRRYARDLLRAIDEARDFPETTEEDELKLSRMKASLEEDLKDADWDKPKKVMRYLEHVNDKLSEIQERILTGT